MVIKITTTYASEIENTERLEPRYYYNQGILKQSFEKFGFEEIRDIALLKSGKTPEHYDEKINEDDVYFIKSADVKRHNLSFTTISYITKETHKSQISSKVIPNDILLSNTGKYLGSACIFPLIVKEGNINQNIIRIRIKDGVKTNLNPYFLLSFLNSYFGQIEIESLLTLTGQKYLNMKNFRDYKIPKIDKNVIEKISIKTKKAEENEIKSLNLLQQVQNLFYQKLAIDFSKIKKENFFSVNLSNFAEADLWTPKYSYPLYVKTLKTIQEKWQTVPLGEIATFKKGNEVGSNNYNKYLEKKDSDVSFIRTSDIVNYEVDQFPDFFISNEIYQELKQDIKAGDVLFTKDGKIGMTGVITKSDKIIVSSGISRLRLKAEAKKYNLTPEYLFLSLSLYETGFYPAVRRTVIASTIPHLREDRLKENEIPILDKNSIDEITKLIKEAFELKDEKKRLIREVRDEIDNYFEI